MDKFLTRRRMDYRQGQSFPYPLCVPMQYFMSTSIPYNCFQKSGKIKKSKLAQWGLQVSLDPGGSPN